jgi:hypothetical protein
MSALARILRPRVPVSGREPITVGRERAINFGVT